MASNCFKKIKHLDDKVKVCFVTAFEESHIEFRRLFPNMEEGDCFIRKPIELRALAQKVKSQLADESAKPKKVVT